MRDVTAAGGERRWTAVLMADMAGSTAMTERIGAEKAYQLLTRLITLAVEAVEREGGNALTFGGDSLLASFGAPVACEEASLHACRAALAFQAAIAAEADALEKRFGIRPQFRIGISGGMVVVGNLGPNAGMDLNIMGPPVNAASRLQEMAQPGQILISDAVFEQVEGEVSCDALGAVSLKGIAGPVNLYGLTGVIDATQRFAGRVRRGLVDMVGRSAQIKTLAEGLKTETPGWQITLIHGSPGIGKSRLLHDLRAQMRNEYRFLMGQCRPGTQTPFKPITEILIAASDATADASPAEILASLQVKLGPGIALEPIRHLLGTYKTPEQSQSDSNFAIALRQTLTTALARLCEIAPTVLVIEDTHWIDGSSAGLIDDLLRASPGHACRMLISSRPKWAAEWSATHRSHDIALDNLSEAQTAELARKRLRSAALAPTLSQLLFEKSEGNPLFVEEILRYLGSTDALKETEAGLALRPGSGLDLAHGNLQHLVMARVDALSPPLRQTLRFAAVLGRQFNQSVLERVEQGRDLSAELGQAAERGLIEADPTAPPGGWRFTHALLRDAIYGSLLEDSRLPMHEILGTALEEIHSDNRDEICEVLAHHFSAAETPQRAAPYLVRTAHKALQVYDLTAVDEALLQVRDMLRHDPQVIDQQSFDAMTRDWLEAMNFKGNFARAIEVAREFLPRMQQGDNRQAIEIAVSHYAAALTHARQYEEAIALALEGIAQAETRGDALGAAWLHLPLLRAYEETSALESPDFQALAERVMATAEEFGAVRLQMQVIYLQAAHFRSHGWISQARERNQALRRFAEEHNDLRARGFTCWAEALILQVSDDIEDAIALAERGMSLTLPGTADAHVLLSIWVANTILASDPRSAKEQLDRVLALSRAYSDYNLIEGNSFIESIYYLRTGQIATGWPKYCRALDLAAGSGNITFTRYFHLVRAEILLTIAGRLRDPEPGPGVPDRRVKPRPRPGLRDIWTLVKLRLNAKRLARSDIAYFRRHFRGDGTGALEARALVCEALLSKNTKQRRKMLDLAAELARNENLPNLVRRIEAQA